jgi:hypothetical protein
MSNLDIVIEAARKWAAHKEAGGYGDDSDTITTAIEALKDEGVGTPTPSDEAIDADVLNVLRRDYASAAVLIEELGWVWPYDGGKLRDSLLRLATKGQAEMRHGFGWRRT